MICINHRDPRPIYLQIKENFIKLILSGALSRDEKMPSVRDLAGSLAINPNTIQRAYRELESEGFIYSIAGKGSYVAPLSEVDGSRQAQTLEQFKTAARELLRLGTDRETLQKLLMQLEQEEQHD